MKLTFFLFLFAVIFICESDAFFPDWLVTPVDWPAKVLKDSGNLVLTNGLVSKTFSLTPGLFGTIDYYSHEKNSSLLRAISPEAIIQLDGIPYNVGGFFANTTRGYLNRTDLDSKKVPDTESFQLFDYDVRDPEVPYSYTPRRGAPSNIVWPPKGVHLLLRFAAPATAPKTHKQIVVTVHYEMYQGLPLLSKWVTLEFKAAFRKKSADESKAKGGQGVRAQILAVEKLCTNWQWSQQGYNWLSVSTDQPHGTLVNWEIEPNASTQEPGSFQPMITSTYEGNFTMVLNQNNPIVTTFRVLELVIGTSDPERTGLAKRQVTRILSPQVQENPIYFHMTDSTSEAFRATVDQLVDVGFEMIMYSFGSGFDLESTNQTYLDGLKADIEYANSKGIEVGGYDLISWTRVVQDDWMALDSDGKVRDSACFASGWYDNILQKVMDILNFANLTVIETDGPYPGYTCSSTNHSHHSDESDSVYQQNLLQGNFYNILRQKGMYINQPDNYFFQGANKAAMGYDESQFSLPRWLDLSISRQGMFDDTFHFIPSQGWMFLPLVVYHAGGEEAQFEPLIDNIKEYEWGLAQYLGAGIAACYRGTRIYDTPTTRNVVKKWVSFYKKYRQILNGDLIHVRRADMQSIDAYLHINNNLGNMKDQVKGLAFFFNPTGEKLNQYLEVPLYYTGLTITASVTFQDDPNTRQIFELRRDYAIEVPISLGPQSFTWMIIE